jgi:hypothetical protein
MAIGPIRKPGIKKAAPKTVARRKAAPMKLLCKSHHKSYAGKWIAWTPDGRRIIASASSVRKVRSLAMRMGCFEPLLERVPRNREPVLEDGEL